MSFPGVARIACLLLCAGPLAGCVQQTVRGTAVPTVETAGEEIPESLLLDLGIVIFDPGLDADSGGELVQVEVRRAEARYLPYLLLEAIQSSAAWGAVRVVPDDEQAMDVLVNGTIVASSGEELALAIVARDATGRVWLDETYRGRASYYSYGASAPAGIDPFQAVYNRIANDLLRERRKVDARQAGRVRLVNELRFARRMSPDAFDGYLRSDKRGRHSIRRLPAEDDPMLLRVRRIRERDFLFIDTLQEYYASFNGQMAKPYQEWRKSTYEEALAAQELKREAFWKLVSGTALVVGGIAAQTGDSRATRTAGSVAILGGGAIFKSGMDARAEAEIHVAALEELGLSLEAEIAPQVIELEDRTITLTGTVADQYQQWRELLRQIYEAEVALPVAASEPASGAS